MTKYYKERNKERKKKQTNNNNNKLKKLRNMKVTVISIVVDALGTVLKGPRKETWELKIRERKTT